MDLRRRTYKTSVEFIISGDFDGRTQLGCMEGCRYGVPCCNYERRPAASSPSNFLSYGINRNAGSPLNHLTTLSTAFLLFHHIFGSPRCFYATKKFSSATLLYNNSPYRLYGTVFALSSAIPLRTLPRHGIANTCCHRYAYGCRYLLCLYV